MKTKRIQELEKSILYHKELYYQGKAAISDEQYDQLEEELKALDSENLVLQLVGFNQAESSKKVKHEKKCSLLIKPILKKI